LRLFLAPTLAAMLLGVAPPPRMPRVESLVHLMTGSWSVAIHTLREDCGSVRAAVRIVGGRVSEDQSYRASAGVGASGATRVRLRFWPIRSGLGQAVAL
jgi:hypothetical protein